MPDELIPALRIIKSLQPRKVFSIPESEKWFVYNSPATPLRFKTLMPIIESHTTGRFLLDTHRVAFENEEDMVMFMLSKPED